MPSEVRGVNDWLSSYGEILIFSSLLFLAWKVGGWYGLDRWLLPRLGTPGCVRRPQTPPRPPSRPRLTSAVASLMPAAPGAVDPHGSRS
ncbi:MAG: hypothetical protein HZY76_13140 [Anaerolineae bacterium]|nr:MAG: hypothetical protein HZY76_13140 [Anaerolineae bacterium]